MRKFGCFFDSITKKTIEIIRSVFYNEVHGTERNMIYAEHRKPLGR